MRIADLVNKAVRALNGGDYDPAIGISPHVQWTPEEVAAQKRTKARLRLARMRLRREGKLALAGYTPPKENILKGGNYGSQV